MTTTLGSMLRSNASVYAQFPALHENAGSSTWAEWVARIARTARLLRGDLQLRPGERFGLLARNSACQAALINAGYWSGLVPVPINHRLAPSEIEQLAEDAGCKRLFVDTGLASIASDPHLSGWRDRMIPIDIDDTGSDDWSKRAAAAEPLDLHESHEDDEALLLYTGGTTGRGKGVPLSHRNILSNALQLARVMEASSEDVYLHVAPMFHSTDLKSTVVSLFGGSHAYLPDFSATGVLEAAARHGITILSLVPTMVARVLDDADPASRPLPALRLVSYGSAPMDESVLRRAMAAFPKAGFHQCYGLTETAPFIALLDAHEHRRALHEARPELLRAAGRPLPGTELRFLDEAGREVASGEAGEIAVRGPQVSRGYLKRPEESAAAWRDGWFHTGDIGRLDADGRLHVLGRKKEMVITGGENVYTREVETVLLRHPQVREAAVVGVPDARFGEALLAVLVLQESGDPPTAEQLIAFCRESLGGFKIPRRYRFVSQLPRTPLGKVKKHELVAAHRADTAEGAAA
ncbi:conserved hypothetical protein [Burkholderiales bacterium 8X]|nr:conserved hypothetical protein [Burkholderiales bacterium 8X]